MTWWTLASELLKWFVLAYMAGVCWQYRRLADRAQRHADDMFAIACAAIEGDNEKLSALVRALRGIA